MPDDYPLESINEGTLKPYDSIWAIDPADPEFWIPVWGMDLPAKMVPYGSPAHRLKQAKIQVDSKDQAQLARLLKFVKKAKGRLPRWIFHAIAVNRLNTRIKTLNRDDLLEVYNELFPAKPIHDGSVMDRGAILDQILDHVHHGIDPEEIVDLWNVVFPGEQSLEFDSEARELVFEAPSELASVLD
jgi:hypothetical protein